MIHLVLDCYCPVVFVGIISVAIVIFYIYALVYFNSCTYGLGRSLHICLLERTVCHHFKHRAQKKGVLTIIFNHDYSSGRSMCPITV